MGYDAMMGKISAFFKKNIVQLGLTFCVGAFVAGTTLFLVRNFPKNGRGGYESPVMPQYSEEFSKLEDERNAQLLAQAEAAENSEQEQDLKPLTYWTYRIRPGDMIGLIAEKYDISQDTLISVNNIRASRLIQPGQYIKIPSEEGILYTVKKDGETPTTIAEKYEVDAVKCAFVNKLDVGSELKAGSSIFVPGAEMDSITLSEINGDLFRKPLHVWYRLTSYFGWRPSPFTGRRSWHGGLDMACPQGTRIYAAMAGRVAETGYNNTYGNYVIINHLNGYKTLYGHMSAIGCAKGQWVDTNTVIGRVGSTGASTGTHLHFTVFKHGKMVNPLALLG